MLTEKEKKLLVQLSKVESLSSVLLIYEKLQQVAPQKDVYWDDYIQFILEEYEFFEVEELTFILEKAVFACDKAIKVLKDPKHTSHFLVLKYKIIGQLFEANPEYYERYSELELKEIVDNAVKENINNAEAHTIRGDFYSEFGDNILAEECYKKAMELQYATEDVSLPLSLAYAYLNNGKISLAIIEFENFLKNDLDLDIMFKNMIYEELVKLHTIEGNEKKIQYYNKLLNGE